MISLAIVALLEHPDQMALLRDTDDPKVVATAVEELMRYLSIIQTGQRRIATEDIEIGDEVIRAGEGIILDVPPANWDARRYPNPDQLDLQREDNQHVGPDGTADRPAYSAAPHPDIRVGGADRRAAVQTRRIGVRDLRVARQMVNSDALTGAGRAF
jgi:hypothetical protein